MASELLEAACFLFHQCWRYKIESPCPEHTGNSNIEFLPIIEPSPKPKDFPPISNVICASYMDYNSLHGFLLLQVD